MTISDKVNWVNKYCGQFYAHHGMIDERIEVMDFNIEAPEEKEIKKILGFRKIIVLTGEAGDGKSRILNNLRPLLAEYHFEIIEDFSAITKEDKIKVIDSMYAVLTGNANQRIILAANIGVFTKSILVYNRKVLNLLIEKKEMVQIYNFEKRNLTSDGEWFSKLVYQFLEYDRLQCEKQDCPHRGHCVFKDNIDNICSEDGIKSLHTLCNTVYLTGGHVTFRELLSLISFMVTHGTDCDVLQDKAKEELEDYRYYQIFEDSNDVLLEKLSVYDPAKKRNTELKHEIYVDGRDYLVQKRKAFFLSGGKYELLFLDYIEEFNNALHFFDKKNFISCTSKIEVFSKLKGGIAKLSGEENTDLEMVVRDTPIIFGKEIQTEFGIELGKIDLIWRRTDLNLKQLTEEAQCLYEDNKFYMSFVYEKDGQMEMIDMPIDYKVFQYLLSVEEGYYRGHGSNSIEEYTVNTFYRKILRIRKESYNKMKVKFQGTEQNGLVNFELELYQKSSLLFAGKTEIKIRSIK